MTAVLMGTFGKPELAATQEVATVPEVDPLLQKMNECLSDFDVTIYKGEDGKHRLWGDINRIQDISDSPCGKSFSKQVWTDLDAFFADEVDVRLAACLVRLGVDARIDRATGVGIEITGQPPTDEQMGTCFKETYDWFRVRPEARSAEDDPSSSGVVGE